ncbi:uncharacterized protein EMH_0088680 [Eimeria mitis]|uniref:Phosphorylated adapter RNA export protein n=1 Tax=Eimeria mitis TaxID=44415 RepID=U6JVL9_9EIME|nr:uncharacterized protein EMH_0088680 [Eimeria mitis]CDJ27563.1 hypothetical protein, conserved [Eimeria mitis]
MHQRGRRIGIVPRRPPVLTENAHCVALKDASSNRGDTGNPRGVKRLYADDEEGGAFLWGCSVATTNDQNGVQKLLERGDPMPPIVERQLGSSCLISESPFRKIICHPDSDGAEEAEIRAEILNGVRQLLRDESEVDCLVRLCALLKEKNTALLERAIHRRGVAECAELLEETLQIEASGGMLTKDGRRRTPGGVFLRLLQDRIPREDKRFIWDEQNREQRRLKRQRIRRQRTAEADVWSHTERTETAVSSAPTLHETSLTECEEREPGELDDAEIRALDEQLK